MSAAIQAIRPPLQEHRDILAVTHDPGTIGAFRDHQVSPWHTGYAESTVEEQVSPVMVERVAAAPDTAGGGIAGLTPMWRSCWERTDCRRRA